GARLDRRGASGWEAHANDVLRRTVAAHPMRRTVLPGGAAGVPPPLLRVREQRSGGETMLDAAERRALGRALEIAADPARPLGPHPRVGCVLLRPTGAALPQRGHRGTGTAHAEADALARASAPLSGATAVVTLEPCAHVGRTGPCADALLEAGISRVVIARRDP